MNTATLEKQFEPVVESFLLGLVFPQIVGLAGHVSLGMAPAETKLDALRDQLAKSVKGPVAGSPVSSGLDFVYRPTRGEADPYRTIKAEVTRTIQTLDHRPTDALHFAIPPKLTFSAKVALNRTSQIVSVLETKNRTAVDFEELKRLSGWFDPLTFRGHAMLRYIMAASRASDEVSAAIKVALRDPQPGELVRISRRVAEVVSDVDQLAVVAERVSSRAQADFWPQMARNFRSFNPGEQQEIESATALLVEDVARARAARMGFEIPGRPLTPDLLTPMEVAAKLDRWASRDYSPAQAAKLASPSDVGGLNSTPRAVLRDMAEARSLGDRAFISDPLPKGVSTNLAREALQALAREIDVRLEALERLPEPPSAGFSMGTGM